MLISALGLYAATLAPIPALLPQEQGGRVLETFSLRSLKASSRIVDFPRIGHQLINRDHGEEPRSYLDWDSDMPTGLDLDTVVELVGRTQQEAWDNGELNLDVHHGVLFATGSREELNKVGAVLAQLEMLATQTITIEVQVLELTGGLPQSTVLTSAERDALVAAHTVAWAGSCRIRSGEVQNLGHQKWTPYVRDCDVEVASNASISDPKIDRFFEGLALAIEAHALTASGDHMLLGQFALANQHGAIQARPTGVADQPSLDAPWVDSMSGTFSGRIPNGGALVVAGAGAAGGPQRAVVIAARSERQATGASALHTIPISALTTRSLQRVVPRGMEDWGGWPNSIVPGSEEDFDSDDDEEGASLSSDILEEMIRSRHPIFDEDESATLSLDHRHIFYTGPADLAAEIRQLIATLEDRFIATDEHRLVVRGGDTVLWSIAAPALRDRNHSLFHGYETTVIGEFEVEIAQKEAIANPVVRSLFSGVACEFTVSSGVQAPTTRWQAAMNQASLVQRRGSESNDVGDLYLPSESRAKVGCSQSMKPGESVDLGEGPVVDLHGSPTRTSVSLTVRTR